MRAALLSLFVALAACRGRDDARTATPEARATAPATVTNVDTLSSTPPDTTAAATPPLTDPPTPTTPPPTPGERWGHVFAAYPAAKQICYGHSGDETEMIFTTTYATRARTADVIAFYKERHGPSAAGAPAGIYRFWNPTGTDAIIVVQPGRGAKVEFCDPSTLAKHRTVIAVSVRMRGAPDRP